MKKTILNLGRVKIVVLITIAAILLSLLIDFFITTMVGNKISTIEVISVVTIPLIVAPIASWYFVGLLINMHKMEKDLIYLATIDDLTGLLNRRYFYKAAKELHDKAINEQFPYCILVVDIDHFKTINDTYGHAIGDKVLSEFGRISKNVTGSEDIVGRLGGEEFGFFLFNKDSKTSHEVAKNIQSNIEKSNIKSSGVSLNYRISIGIAKRDIESDLSMSNVLRNADKAMYQSKESGRNKITHY